VADNERVVTADEGATIAGDPRDSLFTAKRLEAFSDGVMAVIITITAFEIKAPHGTDLSALRQELPLLLVYLLSFSFIGIYWGNHHHLLRRADRISAAVMWSNLHLLFWLSLIPVLTEWAGTSSGHVEPAAVYGVVGLAAAVAYWILVRALIRANDGPSGALAASIGSDLKGISSIGIYGSAIGLAFVSPYVAYGLYAAVAVMWFVPDRRLAR
jgi:uncharacterized membrane protein